MRCRICGRPPTEECCALCHEVHQRLWQDIIDTPYAPKPQARRVLAGLAEKVNQ